MDFNFNEEQPEDLYQSMKKRHKKFYKSGEEFSQDGDLYENFSEEDLD